MQDRSNFWSKLDHTTAGDAILTGYVGDFTEMKAWDKAISLCGTGKNVLDFGCGVGRNLRELAKNFDNAVGFDFPNMVEMCIVPGATSNWEEVLTRKYDVVLATLVFQHIHPEDLQSYMHGLMQVTNKIVIHSRTWFDFTNESVEEFFRRYPNIVEERISNHDDHFLSILHINNG